MTIQVTCNCGARYSVNDGMAGKRCKCQKCQAVIAIPAVTNMQPTGPMASDPLSDPLSDPWSDSLGAMPAGGQIGFGYPQTFGQTNQAFGAPGYAFGPGAQSAAAGPSKGIQGPAMALLVLAIVWIVSLVLFFVYDAYLIGSGAAGEMRQPAGMSKETQIAIRMVFNVLFLAGNGFVAFGAFQMFQLGSYQWSKAAAILSLIPCTSPFYVIGIPFGIWALLRLKDPTVRKEFGAKRQVNHAPRPPATANKPSGNNLALIIGGSAGGVVVLLLVVFVMMLGGSTKDPLANIGPDLSGDEKILADQFVRYRDYLRSKNFGAAFDMCAAEGQRDLEGLAQGFCHREMSDREKAACAEKSGREYVTTVLPYMITRQPKSFGRVEVLEVDIRRDTASIIYLIAGAPDQLDQRAFRVEGQWRMGTNSVATRVRESEPGRERFDGFSVIVPPGFKRVQPDDVKTKMKLVMMNPQPNEASVMIIVDELAQDGAGAHIMAEKWATARNASAQKNATGIDGQGGFKVIGAHRTGSPDDPILTAFVYYGDKAYQITLAGEAEAKHFQPYTAVISRWLWNKDRKTQSVSSA